MKTSRFKSEYRKSSSSLHKIVGNILAESKFFKLHKIYQEYPVVLINPDFWNSKCKYDWVILDMGIVIEIMGEQHYKPVRWSRDISAGEAEMNLQDTKRKDQQKKDAALEVGFSYVELDFNTVRSKDFNEQKLIELITKNKNTATYKEIQPKKKAHKTPDWIVNQRRENSKKQYRRAKEWAKKISEKQNE